MEVKASLLNNLIISCFIRFVLILYGLIHDSCSSLKYTDVDYYVFTDAAAFVAKGDSPYKRDTYRYTPLLAWLLLPNIYLHEVFGKLLFCACDILAAWLIYQLVLKQGAATQRALYCVQVWLYNPLTMGVSTRGNAESLMAVLVLLTLYTVINKNKTLRLLGYVLFGFSVHMKIYPITYSLPIYLYLHNNSKKDVNGRQSLMSWFLHHLWPNKECIQLVFLFSATFCIVTWICYHIYGEVFLQETYLHHITRRDTRHNFSMYFYMLYLTAEASYTKLLGLVLFIPQLLLTVVMSFKFYNELPFCCFLNTFLFVTFNKVCTSQYFLWYLCLLPLVIPNLQVTIKESVFIICLWFLGQAIWLLPAYYLEFQGMATFLWIWLAGILFFCINIFILCVFIRRYDNVSNSCQLSKFSNSSIQVKKTN